MIKNRPALIAYLVLSLIFLLLACHDEAAPGDLDPDLAEEIPSNNGITLGWYGRPYPNEINGFKVLHFWGGRLELQSPRGSRVYGSYSRIVDETHKTGEGWNEIRFYPEGAMGRGQ